jgi:6-phosphogluconolactonase
VIIRSSETPSELIENAARDFAELATNLLAEKSRIRVLLTGGSLGIEFIAAMGKLDLNWSKVFLMFSDERFVALDADDRNERQGIAVWPKLADYLFRFPAPVMDLRSAKKALSEQLLRELGQLTQDGAVFDLTILGMGPDAHVASLFPGHEQDGDWVIAEDNSPKPPSQRLSLSYRALNRSERVWFLAAGDSKVNAVKQSLDPGSGLPAARVRGLQETVWYLDKEITGAL